MLWESSYLDEITATVAVPPVVTKGRRFTKPARKKATPIPTEQTPEEMVAAVLPDPTEFWTGATSLQDIVELPGPENLFLSGFCHITVLCGSAYIGSYVLKAGQRVRVENPCWMPAISITSKYSESNKTVDQLMLGVKKALGAHPSLPLIRLKLQQRLEASQPAVETLLFIEGSCKASQEWILAAEEQSAYAYTPRPSGPSGLVTRASFTSALLATSSVFESAGIDVTSYPASWLTSISSLIESIPVLTDLKLPAKVLICGAKGVGKSTCLRETVNALLSVHPQVYVLDCDCGQPQFTIPGQISLTLVDSPCLSPSYLNQRVPQCSYFVGDVSVKNDPQYVVSAIRKLFDHYTAGCTQLGDKAYRLYTEEEGKKMCSSNKFALLSGGRRSASADAAARRCRADFDCLVPLVVNTDGFIRFLGAEMLTAIVAIVKPTHVFHISTSKDRALPAIEPLKLPGQAVVVNTLEPGRLTPSKLLGVDLRNLRIIAYFLRESLFLREAMRAYLAGESPCTVSIKNGCVLDPHGLVYKAVLSAERVVAPFASACFTSAVSAIAPRFILAGINAAVVGLISAKPVPAASDAVIDAEIRSTPFVSSRHTLRVPLDPVDSATSTSQTYEEFDLHTCDRIPLHPCMHIAIVSAVDLLDHSVQLIPPCGLKAVEVDAGAVVVREEAVEQVIVARSGMQLPSLMTYSAATPIHSYCSGESVGEGGGEMKVRRNIKRKSQRQN